MRQFVPLTVEFVKGYQEKKVSLRFLIIETIVIREVLESVYRIFVADKELVEIEKIPIEEKNRIWILVSNADSTRNKKDMISSCKCLHLVEQILNEKITTL